MRPNRSSDIELPHVQDCRLSVSIVPSFGEFFSTFSFLFNFDQADFPEKLVICRAFADLRVFLIGFICV